MTRHHLHLCRRAYHPACELFRGDPTNENSHAVQAAHRALMSAKGGANG